MLTPDEKAALLWRSVTETTVWTFLPTHDPELVDDGYGMGDAMSMRYPWDAGNGLLGCATRDGVGLFPAEGSYPAGLNVAFPEQAVEFVPWDEFREIITRGYVDAPRVNFDRARSAVAEWYEEGRREEKENNPHPPEIRFGGKSNSSLRMVMTGVRSTEYPRLVNADDAAAAAIIEHGCRALARESVEHKPPRRNIREMGR